MSYYRLLQVNKEFCEFRIRDIHVFIGIAEKAPKTRPGMSQKHMKEGVGREHRKYTRSVHQSPILLCTLQLQHYYHCPPMPKNGCQVHLHAHAHASAQAQNTGDAYRYIAVFLVRTKIRSHTKNKLR